MTPSNIKFQIEKEINRLRNWLHLHSKDKDEGLVRNTELDLYYFEAKLEGIKIGEQLSKETQIERTLRTKQEIIEISKGVRDDIFNEGKKEGEQNIKDIKKAIHIARQCTDFKCVFCNNKDCKNEYCVLQGDRK